MYGEFLRDNTVTSYELPVEPPEAEKRQLQNRMSLAKLKIVLKGFAMGFVLAIPRYGFGADGMSLDYLEDEEIKKDIEKKKYSQFSR